MMRIAPLPPFFFPFCNSGMPTLNISNAVHQRGARYIAIFVALSLLIHGLLFFALIHWQDEDMARASNASRNSPISVRLLEAAPAAPQPSAPVAKTAPPPQPKRAPKPAIAKRKPAHSQIAKLEKPASPAPPPDTKDASSPPAQEMDMLSMLNAARERRAAQQSAETGEGQAPQSTANDIALANINRDLQRHSRGASGTGTVYVRLTRQPSVRTAQFQIRGWNPVSGDSWRQTFDVDAGPNGDVELATVQKMIEWIRSHYSGDFIYESQRLGRTLTLSARPRDNAELEAFLRREFFSS